MYAEREYARDSALRYSGAAVYDFLAGGAPEKAAAGAQNYPVLLPNTGITPAKAACWRGCSKHQ